jgi:hypothetical protein
MKSCRISFISAWNVAERHHKKLEVAMMHSERRLLNVVGVHKHLVVPTTEVKLGEEASTVELIKEFIHH